MKHNFDRAKRAIRARIGKSLVPEDPVHAENVLKWVKKLKGNPGQALVLAALAHDIDRADEKLKVQRSDFTDYDLFKAAHAENSAKILRKILQDCQIKPFVIDEACNLVKRHETGGTFDSDLLKDADSLSFFEVNLPLYFKRQGYKETLRRCVWGYRRLSCNMKKTCRNFTYSNPLLNMIVKEIIPYSE